MKPKLKAKKKASYFLRWLPVTGSLTLMMMISIVSTVSFFQLKAANFWRGHSNEVLATVQTFMTDLFRVEADGRDYVLTGQPDALKTFQNSVNSAPKALAQLRVLTYDNPGQEERLRRVGSDLNQMIAYSQRSVDSRNTLGVESIIQFESSGRGMASIDQTLVDLHAFTEEERRLLRERHAKAEVDFQDTERLLIFGSILAALLVILANLVTGRAMAAMRQAHEQLRAANVELQRQINQRELVERVLYEQNIELQNAAATKDRFLANMSHELRTPLNAIIGFAEFLVDGKPGTLNSKQKEYLKDILNSGRHLLQLISDVLDLVKVGAGIMKVNSNRFSLREFIQEACAVAKPLAQKQGVYISANVAREIGDVTLDQERLKQVLYNLLSNAIKFNHDGGKVEIRAEPYDAGRFRLEVKDTGIGIKAEDVKELFKEFEQLDSGVSRRHEGTGLGLALTRKIVELQGGTIAVESEVGNGSSFAVILPLVMSDVAWLLGPPCRRPV